jgi:hypothetical protein
MRTDRDIKIPFISANLTALAADRGSARMEWWRHAWPAPS